MSANKETEPGSAGTTSHEPPADLVAVGRIADAYGIRGWIKIQPFASDAQSLAKTQDWWLAPKSRPGLTGRGPASPPATSSAHTTQAAASAQPPALLRVLNSRVHGGVWRVAQIAGVDTREQAEALRGREVLISRSAFPPAPEGEYYWVDLIGCEVFGDDDGKSVSFGTVTEVSDNGAHAVLHVTAMGAPVGEPAAPVRERLIPFVDAHVLAVSVPNHRIDTNWPADF